MAGRLEGKVAVITGGCSGIGPPRCAGSSKREPGWSSATSTTVAAGPHRGARITYVHVDVTSKDEVDALFRTAKDTYGSVDVAFNNAGISPPDDDSILTTELDAWRKVQEVNLTSVYLCCKAALPYMLEQGKGSIINTASFVAVMGAATSQISYSASKGGVLSMSRELGVQFAREGVRVNALCPGPVNTPLLQELFATDAGARGPTARARADGPVRRAGRDGQRRALPGLRRVVLHDRLDIPRGRRHLGCVRDALVSDSAVSTPLIGLSTYREQARWGAWDQSADLLPTTYARAIEVAGACRCCCPRPRRTPRPPPPWSPGSTAW